MQTCIYMYMHAYMEGDMDYVHVHVHVHGSVLVLTWHAGVSGHRLNVIWIIISTAAQHLKINYSENGSSMHTHGALM